MPAGAWGEKAGWRFGPLGNELLRGSWAPVHPGEAQVAIAMQGQSQVRRWSWGRVGSGSES